MYCFGVSSSYHSPEKIQPYPVVKSGKKWYDTIVKERSIKVLRDFKQTLRENGYSRQEELTFADCDRNKRIRVAALLSKIAAFAG